MDFKNIMETIADGIDAIGVGVIVAGALIATIWFCLKCPREGIEAAYKNYRHGLGRAILLGLEFLVAGDIIRTVAVAPTLENVGILAVIVLIRTFLSVALQLELEGRLPWQPLPKSPQTTG